MADEYEFIPKRRRWFVQRADYGRQWWIQPAEEDEHGTLRMCEIISGRKWDWNDFKPTEELRKSYIRPKQPISGNEDPSAYCTNAEAQELMDALWQAGMRPTQH